MSFHKTAIERRDWSVSGAKRLVRWNLTRMTRHGEETASSSMKIMVARMFALFKQDRGLIPDEWTPRCARSASYPQC